MKFDETARVRTAIIVIILFSLYSNLQLLLGSARFDWSTIGKDEITLYERRFDRVKKVLPRNGAIGYTGDPVTNADGSTNGAAMRNWYLAQYALAPVVLSTVPGSKLFLINKAADFADSDSGASTEGGVTVKELGFGNKIFNFGNGVKLLSSESQ
ncbi:MAG: hypothetical protein WAV20_03235 [Blastocatellia bacterium]